MRSAIAVFRLAVICCAIVVFRPEARAAPASCSFSITSVNFGNIDVTTNTTFDTTATFNATCSGDKNKTVRVCPNIAEGTGGSSSGNPRLLLSGSNQLNYNLYQNSSRTTVWGSYLWSYSGTYTPPTVDILLDSHGAGSTSVTMYARVSAGQQTKPAGTYTSSFASPYTAIAYAYSTVGTCATIGSTSATAAPFTVTAVNTTACSVSATAVDFGSSGVLAITIDASGTLTLTCTASAPYTVALNGGNDLATDPTQRKMSKGTEKITYGLYRNSTRTLPWGDTTGTNTAAGTGTGLSQNLAVYGRVPIQTTPSPGNYSDTVIVTLTY